MNDTSTTASPSPSGSPPHARRLAANATRYSGRAVLTVVGLLIAVTVAAAVALFFQIGRRRTAAPAYPSGVGVEQRGAPAR